MVLGGRRRSTGSKPESEAERVARGRRATVGHRSAGGPVTVANARARLGEHFVRGEGGEEPGRRQRKQEQQQRGSATTPASFPDEQGDYLAHYIADLLCENSQLRGENWQLRAELAAKDEELRKLREAGTRESGKKSLQ